MAEEREYHPGPFGRDASVELDKIASALAGAQAKIKNPSRDREVEVSLKTGGKFKFRYATLPEVLDAAKPALAEAGIALVQTVTQDVGVTVCTVLLHASGQWLRSWLTVPLEERTAQKVGSAVTYARRYAILALLGMSADDDDDDGASASGHRADVRKRSPMSPPWSEPDAPPDERRAWAKGLADGNRPAEVRPVEVRSVDADGLAWIASGDKRTPDWEARLRSAPTADALRQTAIALAQDTGIPEAERDRLRGIYATARAALVGEEEKS